MATLDTSSSGSSSGTSQNTSNTSQLTNSSATSVFKNVKNVRISNPPKTKYDNVKNVTILNPPKTKYENVKNVVLIPNPPPSVSTKSTTTVIPSSTTTVSNQPINIEIVSKLFSQDKQENANVKFVLLPEMLVELKQNRDGEFYTLSDDQTEISYEFQFQQDVSKQVVEDNMLPIGTDDDSISSGKMRKDRNLQLERFLEQILTSFSKKPTVESLINNQTLLDSYSKESFKITLNLITGEKDFEWPQTLKNVIEKQIEASKTQTTIWILNLPIAVHDLETYVNENGRRSEKINELLGTVVTEELQLLMKEKGISKTISTDTDSWTYFPLIVLDLTQISLSKKKESELIPSSNEFDTYESIAKMLIDVFQDLSKLRNPQSLLETKKVQQTFRGVGPMLYEQKDFSAHLPKIQKLNDKGQEYRTIPFWTCQSNNEKILKQIEFVNLNAILNRVPSILTKFKFKLPNPPTPFKFVHDFVEFFAALIFVDGHYEQLINGTIFKDIITDFLVSPLNNDPEQQEESNNSFFMKDDKKFLFLLSLVLTQRLKSSSPLKDRWTRGIERVNDIEAKAKAAQQMNVQSQTSSKHVNVDSFTAVQRPQTTETAPSTDTNVVLLPTDDYAENLFSSF